MHTLISMSNMTSKAQIEDGMVRPKLIYDLNDEIILSIGVDAFYGDSKGVFGQFKNTDRLVLGVVIGL